MSFGQEPPRFVLHAERALHVQGLDGRFGHAGLDPPVAVDPQHFFHDVRRQGEVFFAAVRRDAQDQPLPLEPRLKAQRRRIASTSPSGISLPAMELKVRRGISSGR